MLNIAASEVGRCRETVPACLISPQLLDPVGVWSSRCGGLSAPRKPVFSWILSCERALVCVFCLSLHWCFPHCPLCCPHTSVVFIVFRSLLVLVRIPGYFPVCGYFCLFVLLSSQTP